MNPKTLTLFRAASHSEAEGKGATAGQGHWRFGRKAKYTFAVAVAVVLLVSFFACLVEQDPRLGRWLGVDYVKTQQASPGLVVPGEPVNSSVWLGVAANAWAYFQPGVGVDPHTGLPYASGKYFEAFTAWDLGVYIQAVIDAQKLGLLSVDGAWGSSARLEKIVEFLENRPLNSTIGYPYWYYDATNGQDYHALSDKAAGVVDGADTGRLFVALNSLRNYNSSLTARIDYLVYNQSDYAALVPGVESGAKTANDVYAYYIDSGYAAFWSQQIGDAPDKIMANIANTANVTTYGVALPNSQLTCEPILCSVFELDSSNAQLDSLMKQVYLAHEAYYDATGKYVAFSEGNSLTSQFLYEWVVAKDAGTWKVTGTVPGVYLNVDPIIYSKVAFSFLALYNSTFAQNLVVYLEKMLPNPSNGYSDGANSSGKSVPGAGCNTNGLILDAALYAVHQ